MMESQNIEPGHQQRQGDEAIAEALIQRPNAESMPCGTGCGLSDVGNRSTDAKQRSQSIKKLCIAVIFCVCFMSLEVAGGLKANSLAVLTDAAHMLTDVAAFAISLFAIWASGWEATPRQTYGFFRLEILGALLSIQLIWLIAGILVYEAIDRILHKGRAVDGRLMFIISTFGFIGNIVMVFLLGHHGHGHDHDHDHDHSHSDVHWHDQQKDGHKDKHGHEHSHKHEDVKIGTSVWRDTMEVTNPLLFDSDLERAEHSGHVDFVYSLDADKSLGCGGGNTENKHSQGSTLRLDQDVETSMKTPMKNRSHWNINVQGAYLHVLGDLIQSIGVMIGGAVIWVKPEWKIIDLICTLFFSLLVLGTTIKMLRSILEVLMEFTPREIDANRLEEGLCAISGVLTVHDLHIWAITVGKILLACHVRIRPDANSDEILQKVVEYIEREYKISHVTIQIEREL